MQYIHNLLPNNLYHQNFTQAVKFLYSSMTRIMALLLPEPKHQTVHANFHLLEAEYDLSPVPDGTLIQSDSILVSVYRIRS